MSRLFESFDFLHRGWDVRLLEAQSLRSVFVALLLHLFMLGVLIGITIYTIFHLHRFPSSIALICLALILPCISLRAFDLSPASVLTLSWSAPLDFKMTQDISVAPLPNHGISAIMNELLPQGM